MIVLWFFLILLITEGSGKGDCVKNKIKLWSTRKCQAGRTFFAKFGGIPGFAKTSQPYLYPWLAEIRVEFPGQRRGCTGVLINDKYVLTAQNCVYPPIQPAQVSVHVGFYNGYKKDITELFQPRILERKATCFVFYPNYKPIDPRTAANNLALIKLNQPVKYSKTIYPIQLPAPGDIFRDWGNTLTDDVEWLFFPPGTLTTKQLKENIVRILNPQQCASYNNDYAQIVSPQTICSVNVNNGSEICGEENGSLLTIKRPTRLYTITVLIAWQPPTSGRCSELPRVYIRIDNKLNWIKANTKDGEYCRY